MGSGEWGMGRRARNVRAAAADGRVTDVARRAPAVRPFEALLRTRPRQAGGRVLATGRGRRGGGGEEEGVPPRNAAELPRRRAARARVRRLIAGGLLRLVRFAGV